MEDTVERLQRLESVRAIEALNTEYARLIDAGRLEEFADLFRGAVWRNCVGADAVLSWLKENVRLYGETPRTHHLVSGLVVEIEPDGATARGTSTITVLLQPEAAGPIVAITVSDYHDEYALVEGRWRFRTRQVTRRLEGDMTAHLRDQRA